MLNSASIAISSSWKSIGVFMAEKLIATDAETSALAGSPTSAAC